MDPFIQKLEEFGLSGFSHTNTKKYLSTTPPPNTSGNISLNLHFFSEDGTQIVISNLALFKKMFQSEHQLK